MESGKSVSEQRNSGNPESGWRRTTQQPERWERGGFGAVEARGPTLWAIIPRCGHSYGAMSLFVAQLHLERQGGLCFSCWHRQREFRSALRQGRETPPDGSALE